MTLLEQVARVLQGHRIAYALIGAALIGAGALAVHAVSRSTLDHDLLAVQIVDVNGDDQKGSH